MPNYTDHAEVIQLLEKTQDADQDNRSEAREDQKFVSKKDGQWEDSVINLYQDAPRYTFDHTSPIIDQIAGDISAADFDIKVKPAGGGATKDNAELLDGLIRNIETMSNAQGIYAKAGRKIATGGFDAWMLKSDYANDESFDQDLMIEYIFNAYDRVWFDLASVEQDRSDADHAFLLSAIPIGTYRERFPDGSGLGVSQGTDYDEDYCDKAEYVIIGHVYYRKLKPRDLVKVNTGEVFEGAEFDKVKDELAEMGIEETDRRTVNDSVFCVRKFDGAGWLEEAEETVFSYVPIIPTYGNFEVIENKPIWHGAVRKLRDPQRVYNYGKSREVAEGALSPKPKYWATPKQVQGYEDELATLNTNNKPVQIYNVDAEAPNPPQQQGGAMVNQGLVMLSDSMQQIMGQSAGIFAAGMGNQAEFAQSGIAIDKLQKKGNNITTKYFTSLEMAICHTAKILIDAIPRVYDAQRQIRIMNEDGSFDMKEIFQPVLDNETGQIVYMNDLSAGKYDVTCVAGQSYDSRQSETLDQMLQMIAVDPSSVEMGADIIWQQMSGGGTSAMAERKRRQLFEAGLIPDVQLTEEEQAEKQQMEQQPPQPDAAMALAQAEMAKAEADMQSNQLTAQKNQNEVQLKVEELKLKQQELALKGREQELKIAEKSQSLNLDAQSQQFNQMMEQMQLQLQATNDEVDRMKKEAETLKTMREANNIGNE